MNWEKIDKYFEELQDNLSIEEIIKLFREILYSKKNICEETRPDNSLNEQLIYLSQKASTVLDLISQNYRGNSFEWNYLESRLGK